MRSFVLAAMMLAAFPGKALAWGEIGHETVALIASHLLTPAANRMVEEVLRSAPAPKAMRDIALWADRNGLPETSRWHTVAIPPTGAGYDRARDCPDGECIVEKVGSFIGIIRNADRSPEERATALAYTIHFVGDIHMPVHAFAPLNPQSGIWMKVGEKVEKFHLWWDDEFILTLGSDPENLAAELTPKITADQRRLWSSGSPAEWANESFNLAREFIARHNLISSITSEHSQQNPIVLPVEVLDELKPAIARRLQMAGVRLAWAINKAAEESEARAGARP
jgi:hypothetical protein